MRSLYGPPHPHTQSVHLLSRNILVNKGAKVCMQENFGVVTSCVVTWHARGVVTLKGVVLTCSKYHSGQQYMIALPEEDLS